MATGCLGYDTRLKNERAAIPIPQAPSVEGAVSLGLTEEGFAERRILSRFNAA